MTNLPLFPDEMPKSDDIPLPLMIANYWNFPLAYVETDEGIYYAVQDWLRGLLGGEVRYVLMKLLRRVEISKAVKSLPYKSTDGKTYRRPYIDEQWLMYLLTNLRATSDRQRLIDIRNHVATLLPEYRHLKCYPGSNAKLAERVFQATLVTALHPITKGYEIKQYFALPSGRVIDVVVLRERGSNPEALASQVCSMRVLIECKVQSHEFFKAIGQLIAYKAEASQESFDTSTTVLALAMPYEEIGNYIRNIAQTIGILLISVVDNALIDAITCEWILPGMWALDAFVDEMESEPVNLIEDMRNANKLLNAFIGHHRKQGKDHRWIQMRIESMVKRNEFTTEISEFVRDTLTPRHFAILTDDVYRGLWGRNSSQLKGELGLSNTTNLRDHQPTLALYYQGIVEEVCAQKIGARVELWWEEARDIIRTVAAIIGRQAKETSELMATDLATGKPLLPGV